MAAENARKRGKRARMPRRASMRPRRMAAENEPGDSGENLRFFRFNEAAANGRGKLTSPCTVLVTPVPLQ